ncbi:MAG: hypothetical protein SF187_03100 [Deltaproteobacteria bacterium]|nr:hypothetical protein [Deltaproteobacteria bacterium]
MRRLLFIALTAFVANCGTVDLGPTPADINTCRPSQQFFYQRVWPELIDKDYGGKKCGDARCHDASSGREMIVVTPTSMATLPLPEDWMRVYRSVTGQLQCTSIAESPLLARPDGRQTHGGGKLFEPGGPQTTLLRMWAEAK